MPIENIFTLDTEPPIQITTQQEMQIEMDKCLYANGYLIEQENAQDLTEIIYDILKKHNL